MEKIDKDTVLIEWVDSKGMERWEYLDEIESMKPSKCFSAGFLIEETKQYKTLAQSISETQVIGRTSIPCCSIQSIKEIKL